MNNKNIIYIGDNLSVMNEKNIEQYKEKVKMIYIDPPYNTKAIKTYNDNIKDVDWVSFIEERIKKSKEFLREDGVIFISIDDNEYAELKIICDKVFGKENFVGNFITYQSLRSNSKLINTVHEYVLCFAKNKKKVKEFKIKRMDIPEDKIIIDEINRKIMKIFNTDGKEKANQEIKRIVNEVAAKNNITWIKNYSNVDEKGQVFFAMDLSTPGEPRKVNIKEINLVLEPLKTRGWSSDEKFIELYNEGLLVYKNKRPYEKHLLVDACDNITSVLKFFSRNGTEDLKKMGIQMLFDTPKPVELIKYLIKISCENNDLIMDFFAGCGTTAQAVYEINKEKNMNLQYIIIQLNEKINKKTRSYAECIKRGIEPLTSEVMKYRIDTYLKINEKEKDYEIFELRDLKINFL